MSARVLEHVVRTSAGVAVLERTFDVQVVNISASGALLETEGPLEPGAIGKLTMAVDGRRHCDHVRVTRSQAIAGGSRHLVAVEFLWIDVPSRASLRHHAMQLPRRMSRPLLSLLSVPGHPDPGERNRDRVDAEVTRSDYW